MIYVRLLPHEAREQKGETLSAMMLATTLGLGACSVALAAYGVKAGLPIGTLTGILFYVACMFWHHRQTFVTGQVPLTVTPYLILATKGTTVSSSIVEIHFWSCFWRMPVALTAMLIGWNWN
jgi:hypothetical protein